MDNLEMDGVIMQNKSRMKGILPRVFAALLILTLLTPAAFASFKANVYTSSMKVYKSASSSSKKLGTLPSKTEVTVLSYSKGWAKIQYKGKTGYAQIKNMASQKRMKAYAKKSAAVYKSASSSSKKLGTVSTGTTLYVVGMSGSYYLVQNSSGKTSGYIKTSYVTKTKPSTTQNNTSDNDTSKDDSSSEPKETDSSMPSGLKSSTSSYSSSMSNSQKLEYVIYVAQNQLGKPYSSSPKPPSSYDCAGLVRYCFDKAGIKVKASAYSQGYDSDLTKISSASQLKRGDIVCFNTNDTDDDLSDHTGIYLGSGYFIHASSAGKKVIVSNLNSGYYKETFSWGRRVFD